MEKKNQKQSNKKELEGIVVSNKMDKTVRVRVETKRIHPRYKKIVGYRKIYFAHTNKDLEEGEKVTIRESKPYSKNVKWIVV